ncbi:MAG TPA: transglycosylase family protein [Capillimicrobium sp.]|jgi:hypothetical protein
MSPIRTLAAVGAAAAVGAPAAIALAAEPAVESQVSEASVLRAEVAGESIAEAARSANRVEAHRGLLRELRRHDRRPRGAVAALTARELRAATRELRAERREAAAAAEAAAAQPTGVLASIAACESGGDPAAIGGGGLYRGMYQFDQATWESVGGVGDPAAASVAEQTRRAQILLDRAGTSPWPVCGG